MRRETLKELSRKFDNNEQLLRHKFKSSSLKMKWPQMISLKFKNKRKRLLFNMIARNLKSRSLETLLMLKLIVFTVLKIVNISLRCQWKSVRKKFRFIRTFSFLNPKLQRKKDTRSLLSCNTEKLV
jgi:hypothetical protein